MAEISHQDISNGNVDLYTENSVRGAVPQTTYPSQVTSHSHSVTHPATQQPEAGQVASVSEIQVVDTSQSKSQTLEDSGVRLTHPDKSNQSTSGVSESTHIRANTSKLGTMMAASELQSADNESRGSPVSSQSIQSEETQDSLQGNVNQGLDLTDEVSKKIIIDPDECLPLESPPPVYMPPTPSQEDSLSLQFSERVRFDEMDDSDVEDFLEKISLSDLRDPEDCCDPCMGCFDCVLKYRLNQGQQVHNVQSAVRYSE